MFSEPYLFFLYFCNMKYKIKKYQSADIDALVKNNINETWLCRVVRGGVTLKFDLKQHRITSETIFIVPEGVHFKAVSSTSQFEMELLVFDESLMNVVYSLLGADADFGSLDHAFWSNRSLVGPFGRLMEMDYESLTIAIKEPFMNVRHKMITSSLTHLLLTIYNAVSQSGNNDIAQEVSNRRPRLTLNRYYEMVGSNVFTGGRNTRFYADKLCVTERYLYKICKKETGQSPKEIIDNFLVSAIKNSLLTTEMSLQQIADQYRFPDQSAFSQYFKRLEGISPSEFRRRYR